MQRLGATIKNGDKVLSDDDINHVAASPDNRQLVATASLSPVLVCHRLPRRATSEDSHIVQAIRCLIPPPVGQ